MFRRKEEFLETEPAQVSPKEQPGAVFVEFRGAMAEMDEDTNTLRFVPRGPIRIQVSKIGAYYDNTILLFGNKIRVMETAAQIELKILQAMK